MSGPQIFAVIDPTSGDDIPTIMTGSTGTYNGYNFSIVRNAGGHFTVTFQPALDSIPAVVGSVVEDDPGASSHDTRDNVVINTISTETFDLFVGDHEGDLKDFRFSFIALAPS